MIGGWQEEQDAQCRKKQSAYHRDAQWRCLVTAPHESQGQGDHSYDHGRACHEDGSQA